MLTNALNLNDLSGGNRIKQGDTTTFKYVLLDYKNEAVQLNGKEADVYLYRNNITAYYTKTTVDDNNSVTFIINKILEPGVYTVEIVVSDEYSSYKFPSNKQTKIEITPSIEWKNVKTSSIEDILYKKLLDYGISKGYFNNDQDKTIETSDIKGLEQYVNDGIDEKLYGGYDLEIWPRIVNIVNESYKNIPKNESALKDKTGVFIGDSITETNFRTSKNYHQFIAERTGLNVINLGVSGTGYVDRINAVDSIAEQPDFIAVFLGTNDYSGVTGSKILGNVNDTESPTLASHIYTLLLNLMNKFPNTPIVTITPLPRIESNPMNENQGKNGYKLVELVEMIKGISKRLAIPCLDLYHNSHLRIWYDEVNNHFFAYTEGQADGLHPNYHGHEYISYPIQSFLEQHVIIGNKQPFVSDGNPITKITPKATFETADDGSTIATIPGVLPTWKKEQSFMLRVPAETLNLAGKKITEAEYNGHKILNPNDFLGNNPFWYAVSTYPKGEFNRIDEINDFVQHLNYVGDTEYGKTYKPITIKIKYK